MLYVCMLFQLIHLSSEETYYRFPFLFGMEIQTTRMQSGGIRVLVFRRQHSFILIQTCRSSHATISSNCVNRYVRHVQYVCVCFLQNRKTQFNSVSHIRMSRAKIQKGVIFFSCCTKTMQHGLSKRLERTNSKRRSIFLYV